jgi:ribosomal protein S18 acetylase RimI-like enzyme
VPGPPLTFRRIDVDRDGPAAYARYRDAAEASLGSARAGDRRLPYLAGLRERLAEYPDGHVLAVLDGDVIGQLELQVPYGLTVGYVNLFYVAPRWRRLGFGRLLHDYAVNYFRSWDAKTVELHVGPANGAAVAFYRSVGYRLVEAGGARLWKMRLELDREAVGPG